MAGPIANLTVRLSAQIAEFQSEFREASKSTAKFQQDFTGMATKASAMGNLIANGLSNAASQIGSFAKSIVDSAGHMVDLSGKTGLTLDTLQRFQYVAEQTGTTVDAFTNATFKLGANLAGDNKSVAAAVNSLGLSFSELRKLSPDEQFKAIAAALGSMVNPQERNRIALELFGRSVKDILPAITEGYEKLAAGANVASDAQLKALDEAGDAWSRFVNHGTNLATKFAGNIIRAFEAADKATLRWAEALHTGRTELELIAQVAEMQKGIKAPATGVQSLGMPDVDFEAEQKKLDALIKKQVDANEKATKSAQAHAEAVARIRDSWTGMEAVQKLNEITAAFKGAIPLQALSTDKQKELNKVVKEAIDAAERMKQTVPQAWRDIYAATFDYAAIIPEIPPAIRGITDELERLGNSRSLELPRAQLQALKLTAKDVAGAFQTELGPGLFERLFGGDFGTRLGQTILGAIQGGGNILKAAGSFIGQTLTTSMAKSLTANFGDMFGGALGTAINAFLPGLGSLLGPLASKIGGFFKGIFGGGSAGRDAIEAFAETFGGFRKLQDELVGLGQETYDKLWKQLNEVGKNNAGQAEAAIKAVTAALDAQKKKQEEVTSVSSISTEAQAQATIETATAAAAALDEVSGRLIENAKHWGTWSEDVTGYLQKVADAVFKMPIPGPTGTVQFGSGVSVGSSGGVQVPVSTTAGFAGGGGGRPIVVQTVLDGRVIAESMAPHHAEYLQSQGL